MFEGAIEDVWRRVGKYGTEELVWYRVGPALGHLLGEPYAELGEASVGGVALTHEELVEVVAAGFGAANTFCKADGAGFSCAGRRLRVSARSSAAAHVAGGIWGRPHVGFSHGDRSRGDAVASSAFRRSAVSSERLEG